MQNLNLLKNKVYQTAVEHGWHDEPHSGDHWAMLIITEISEAIQADRSDQRADMEGYHASYDEFASSVCETAAANLAYDAYCKNTFEDELADICIRTLDMAGVYGMDLSGFDSFIDNIENGRRDKARLKRIAKMSVTEWGFDTTQRIVTAIEEDIMTADFYCIIRQVMLLAKSKDIDLTWFVENKMLYNESRPYRHGGKKY